MKSTSGRFARFAQKSPLTAFFVLAYAVAWVLWTPLVLSKNGLGLIDANLDDVWAIPGSFGPSLAGLYVHWLITGNLRFCRIVTSWPSLLFGMVLGFAAVTVAYVVLPAMAIASTPITSLNWNVLLTWSSYHWSLLAFLGGPLGEEPGWRGFALPRLQNKFGPIHATLILSLLWAGWHLPAFLLSGWAGQPVWSYVFWLTGFSIIATCAANLSGFSIVVALIIHALLNNTSRLMWELIGNNPRRVSENDVLAYIAVGASLIVPLALILITKGKLFAAPQLFGLAGENVTVEPSRTTSS